MKNMKSIYLCKLTSAILIFCETTCITQHMVLLQVRKDTSNYSAGSSSQREVPELCVIHKQFRYSSYAQLKDSTYNVISRLSENLAMQEITNGLG